MKTTLDKLTFDFRTTEEESRKQGYFSVEDAMEKFGKSYKMLYGRLNGLVRDGKAEKIIVSSTNTGVRKAMYKII